MSCSSYKAISVMAAFHGVERKLSIFVLSILTIGWLIYLSGFILILVQTKEEDHGSLFWMPWIVTAAGAPLLCILTLIHAGLPRLASSIVGTIAAFVGSLFIISSGYVLCSSGILLYGIVLIDQGLSLKAPLGCSFTGTFICIHCCSIILSLSTRYKDGPTELTVPNSKVRGRLFKGVIRKITIPAVILSFIGWLVLLSGLFTAKSDPFQGFPEGLPAWGILFFGIPIHLFYLIHAGSWGGASTAMGIATSVFGTVYSVFVGYFLYLDLTSEETNSTERSLIISGSTISWFFLACVLMLWPFYKRPGTWTIGTRQPNQGSSSSVQADETQPLLQSARQD